MIDTKKELTICWSITSRCNKSCYYCFSNYDSDSKKDMNDEIRKISVKKLEHLHEIFSLRIVLLGGEPTIYQDFENLCEELTPIARKIIIVTNGTNIQRLPKNTFIDISYHGQNTADFFDIVNQIRKRNFVQVLCVIDPKCIKSCYEVSDFCRKECIPFEAIPLVNNATEESIYYTDSILSGFTSNIQYENLDLFGKKTNLEIYRQSRDIIPEKRLRICEQKNIALYADGSIYPCCKTGWMKYRNRIESNKAFQYEILCEYPYCMKHRGCLDMAGWRQDPDEKLF